MISILHPWQIVVLALAGWFTRLQMEANAYLQEENRPMNGADENPPPRDAGTPHREIKVPISNVADGGVRAAHRRRRHRQPAG
jgi:hypothetical protein